MNKTPSVVDEQGREQLEEKDALNGIDVVINEH